MTTDHTLLIACVILVGNVLVLSGITLGWLGAERYMAWLAKSRHEYEELFEENPHPEIYGKDGKINRGDYMSIVFDPGFDPKDFDPEDIKLMDDEED